MKKEQKEMTKKEELSQLRGIAKILNNLWENSYNVRRMDERIKIELEYFFGKNWAVDMYKFAGMESQRPVMPRPLKELKKKSKSV